MEPKFLLDRSDLNGLIDALHARSFTVVGPTVRESAIVFDELRGVDDLPIGWTDDQAGGKYRLKRRDDSALFGYNVGPQAWKKFLHPPVVRLAQAQRDNGNWRVEPQTEGAPRYAFLGVRACDIAAIQVQDRVFMGGTYADPIYATRRAPSFIVAVNCGQAGGTCFCVSMKTGPRATQGFDLALTEIVDGSSHYFVGEIGSERGAEVMNAVPHRAAPEADIARAEAICEETAQNMGRTLNQTGLKELLYSNYEHPSWNEVAKRCLTCANCTMVCPTCFCTTVEDVTDLAGDQAERWRKWDSCFTMDFSYIHGGSVRPSSRARYRQWMTHKLATWIDQFGTSGCVGCGRCITWCPVGIDITEQVRAIREGEGEK